MGKKPCMPSWQQAYDVSKLVAPAHVAVIILTILVLIPHVTVAIGTYSFLVLVYLHLFFYPEGTIGDHLEKVLTHLFMCALGQGITFLFVCITIWLDGPDTSIVYNTNGSKALGASVLALWCLLGGICESRYPKIRIAIRIFLFSSTWTICIGATTIEATIFTNQFYPAALAAITSLIANLLVFPRSAQDDFASLIVKYYSIERSFLQQVLLEFYSKDGIAKGRQPSQELAELQRQLGETAVKVEDRFRSARLEVNYGHFAIYEAKSLATSIGRRKGWMSCGMGLGTREGLQLAEEKDSLLHSERLSKISPGSSADMHRELKDLQPAISKLMSVMNESITILSASIDLTMRRGDPLTLRLDTDGDNGGQALFSITRQQGIEKPSLIVLRQRQRMTNAIESFKEDLALILQRLATITSNMNEERATEHGERQSSSSIDDPRHGHGIFQSDIYDTAFLMVSLMEIASEIEISLTACQSIIAQWHAHPRKRLYLPTVSFASWIRTKLSRESHTGFVFHEEERQGEHFDFSTSFESVESVKQHKHSIWENMWTWTHRPNVIRWRVALSKSIKTLKHSIDLKYGLKLAGGAVLLSLPAWISSARSWFVAERGVWLVVTYIWVLETSTGATIRVSIYRAIGTIAGAVWAIVAWYICSQGNRYGIAFFVILAEVPACYFILFTRHAQSLGVVFALTQSVILFFPFTTFNVAITTSSVVHLGLVRGYQILLGIVAAFVVNLFIWPLHARVYLIGGISRITRQCSTIYLSLARQMLNHGIIIGPETTRKFVKLENNIQKELMASRDYLEIMHVEISLVPKPVHTLSLVIKTLQRVVDLLNLLRKCREIALRIIQKEACFNVLNLRKDLVSNILLTFWIIGQSLVTKERLPQFLPSCRDALMDLTQAMRDEIRAKPLHVDVNHADHQEEKEGHIDNLAIPSRLLPRKRTKHSQPGTPTSSHPDKKVIDYSYFFVFAEHTLLSEIIFEMDKLLFLTKLLVGESSFIGTNYLPKRSEDGQRGNTYSFDPSILGSQDAHAFHNSLSEHGIDGRRLAAQLDAQLRATK